MSADEFRARYVDVIARELFAVDADLAGYGPDDFEDWAPRYHRKAEPYVDALAEVGLLLTSGISASDGSDDRAPADTVTAPFQTIMDVYIDGMGTGIATALGSLRPDAPNAVIDQATQGLVGRTLADPIAVEQLAEKVRQRLRGEEDEQIDEVRVYGGGDRG